MSRFIHSKSSELHYSSPAVTFARVLNSWDLWGVLAQRLALYPDQMSYDFSLNLFLNSHPVQSVWVPFTKRMLDDIIQMQSGSSQKPFPRNFIETYSYEELHVMNPTAVGDMEIS